MLYNCHVHTKHSHDSVAEPMEMCRAAAAKGLAGIAVTDHCDCEYTDRIDMYGVIEASVRDAGRCKQAFAEKLTVLQGVEVGDALFDLPFAKWLIASLPFDVVLCSVHAVRYPGFTQPFSTIDFSAPDAPDPEQYLRQYFIDLYETPDLIDFDILSHLTVPLRYINGKYGRNADLSPHLPQIERILKKLIALDKTLEFNTSDAIGDAPLFMPDETVLRMYLDLGGKHFSLGSDAHVPENIDRGLQAGAGLLKKLGVEEICYYEERERITYPL
ncbi:MAG: histidinol-phosphatase HisJ family protein [Clostridia bacterium]|nr:histidinol-phosphatase HisJ family protein [Clostridia bacterium]